MNILFTILLIVIILIAGINALMQGWVLFQLWWSWLGDKHYHPERLDNPEAIKAYKREAKSGLVQNRVTDIRKANFFKYHFNM